MRLSLQQRKSSEAFLKRGMAKAVHQAVGRCSPTDSSTSGWDGDALDFCDDSSVKRKIMMMIMSYDDS